MSKRDSLLLVKDMLDACQKIQLYTKDLEGNQFLDDDRTKDAVIRNFEIIGEAANRLDEGYKTSINSVDWNQLRGFRNRIIHEYFGVDYELVWEIIQKDIGPLSSALEDCAGQGD
jgi:uncharacterized protein with HEPN domain